MKLFKWSDTYKVFSRAPGPVYKLNTWEQIAAVIPVPSLTAPAGPVVILNKHSNRPYHQLHVHDLILPLSTQEDIKRPVLSSSRSWEVGGNGRSQRAAAEGGCNPLKLWITKSITNAWGITHFYFLFAFDWPHKQRKGKVNFILLICQTLLNVTSYQARKRKEAIMMSDEQNPIFILVLFTG